MSKPRHLPALLLTGLVSLLLGGCGEAPSPVPERIVVVYTAVDQDRAEPVLKEYERRTGVKVLPVYDVEASKTTGLVNRLIAEKGRPQADVFWNTECVQTLLLKQTGVLAPYRSPQANSLPLEYRDPEGYWAAFGGRARVILINTREMKGMEPPASLFDFGSGKWPVERTGVSQPLFGTAFTHAVALYATLGPEKARDFFVKLKGSGVRTLDGNSVVRDQVVSGALLFGMVDSDDADVAVRAGDPVKVILPDPEDSGTIVIPGSVGLIADSPHPDEGKRLIDYLLSPDAEAQLVRSGFMHYPCRPLPDTDSSTMPPGAKPRTLDIAALGPWVDRARKELVEIFLR